MMRCAFLTMEDPSGYVIDDDLAYGRLESLGWRVEGVPWTRPQRWGEFDAVVIRSTWDYVGQSGRFLAVLAAIERSGARLFNELPLVRWNLDKRYLRDLEERGVPIVPTVWRERLQCGELAALFDEAGAEEIVVKQVVGAGAIGAYRLRRGELTAELADEVERHYAGRGLMAQPFVESVVSEGEYSLFYFNGEYSHAILKIPRAGDYRVQEEWGSELRTVAASGDLRAAAEQVMVALRECFRGGAPPLYARVDLVRSSAGTGFWLMELELVEPSLYLRMDEGAAERLARAIDRGWRSSP